ncbi:MAG: hypothetical protein JJ896_17700 [Rhodothermales bacterium]|nr:hypothetical protein [Rhodothermales bacterium]MBO6781497.1 hypothetical protein [Rhodothermales bacterium]
MEPSPDEMIALAQLFAEAMNQLSFIAALMGGFAIALLAGVITTEKTRLSRWTVSVLSASSLLLIACTLYLAMASFRILTRAANRDWEALSEVVASIDPTLMPFIGAFGVSFVLFFTGIALTGWIFGRKTGWTATLIAVLAFLLAFWGLVRVL